MPTVMIVDDEANVCERYRQELEYYGYDVKVAHTGQEALDAVSTHHIDVVVLDVAMPGMDGIDTLAKILAVQNELPVILNTGYASYKDDFRTWAAEAYITKTSDIRELLDHLEKTLAKRGIAPPEAERR